MLTQENVEELEERVSKLFSNPKKSGPLTNKTVKVNQISLDKGELKALYEIADHLDLDLSIKRSGTGVVVIFS